GAEANYNDARDKIGQAISDNGSIAVDSQRALALLRTAYGELATAEKGGVQASLIDPLRARAVHGLDFLYSAKHAKVNPIIRFDTGAQPAALSVGPTNDDNALYYIDSGAGTVSRIDLSTKQSTPKVIIQTGMSDGTFQMATPRF